MSTSIFYKDLLTAHNLKFDFSDGENCEDLIIECRYFDIKFNAYSNTSTSITQADYLQPSESNTRGSIEIFNAVKVDEDCHEVELTEGELKELEELINEVNL